MRTKHAIPVCLIFTLLLPGAVLASDTGTTSADFLNLGAGPRAIAMGDAQVGLADDVFSTYWNPAGLSTMHTQEAAFVHTEYVQSITQQYVAYALPHPTYGAFGLSFSYLGYGGLPGYDAAAQPTGGVNASDMDLGLSYSHDLYRDERYGTQLSAGLTGKWIQERLDTVSASSYAGDLGLLFSPGIKWGEFWNGWKAGLAMRNLGAPITFDQESFALPRVMTAGLSYTGNWRDELITLALDGRQPNDGPQTVGIGLEVLTLKTVILRGGYTSEGDLGNGLRIGAGLRFKTIQVDYSFASEGAFGVVHRLGLTLRFAPPQENPKLTAQRVFDKGMREYKKQQYTDSLVDFSKALEIDGSHPQALDMMKKTYEALHEKENLNLQPAR